MNTQPRRTIEPSQSTPFVKRLSRFELESKRARGLCFNCYKTYAPGHRCKKLFLLEGTEDAFIDDPEVNDDNNIGGLEISIHAIARTHSAKTMQVMGYISLSFENTNRFWHNPLLPRFDCGTCFGLTIQAEINIEGSCGELRTIRVFRFVPQCSDSIGSTLMARRMK